MATSDQFKDELQNNNFIGALKTVLSQAIELEIVTWVVPAEQEDLTQDTPEDALPGHLMRTRINLVDGDIENMIGSHFVGSGPYAELRQFHLEQVQRGQDIIQKNLTNAKQLFEILAEKTRSLPQTERLAASSDVPELSSGDGKSWPSVSQKDALADDDQVLEEGNPELDSGELLLDDGMLPEPDPTLTSGSSQLEA